MTNRKSDCRKNSESNRIQSRRKLKKAVSKVAAREGQAYPLGYVEALNDTRTLLADFFSFLLKRILSCCRVVVNCRGRLLLWLFPFDLSQ
jgi:hypothetical protein